MKVTPVADGVTFVQGPLSNWVVVVGEGEVGLIDTGYSTDTDLVLRSIAQAGGEGLPISTALITHGHSDHIGGAAELVRRFGTVVLASEVELPNVRRTVTEQITFREVLPRLWRPRIARWVWGAVAAGGLNDVGVPGARALAEGPLRIAGFTVVPIASPGHSRGHTAYLLPDVSALVTGDALVSAHPTSALRGAQLLPDVFHSDAARARTALDAFTDVSATVILPGHGPLIQGSSSSAVAAARAPAPARQRVPGPDGGAMPDAPFWM